VRKIIETYPTLQQEITPQRFSWRKRPQNVHYRVCMSDIDINVLNVKYLAALDLIQIFANKEIEGITTTKTTISLKF
jgi:hypothetical protein